LRFLKIGARIREVATRVTIHYPTSFPLKEIVAMLLVNVTAIPP